MHHLTTKSRIYQNDNLKTNEKRRNRLEGPYIDTEVDGSGSDGGGGICDICLLCGYTRNVVGHQNIATQKFSNMV